ncbi:MAG TPA: MltA domain-containing protein [Syntrophales bacterium]|nr:MltA domain-containing protein [Syntrophales bacterium]
MTRPDQGDRPRLPMREHAAGGRRAAFLLAMLILLLGCDLRMRPAAPEMAPSPDAERLAVSPDDLDDASLEKALAASLRYYESLSPSAGYPLGGRRVTVRELQDSLLAFRRILLSWKTWPEREREIRRVFDFVPSEGADGKGTVLFTGYFEPVLEGAPSRTERFRYPLYRTPTDAVTVDLGRFNGRWRGERIVGRLEKKELVPYYSRDEIDRGGALAGRGLELLWVDDPVDLFLLHVQGSGIVRMETGGAVRVHGVASNGRPYRSVARHLADLGRISVGETAYLNFKAYLRGLPHDQCRQVLGHNERYIFFRLVEEGPVGSLGFPVTAGRSIATDPRVFPEGALALVRLRKPVLDEAGNVRKWDPVARYVLNQDRGSAIKGPGRVDLFCGSGRDAEMFAGSIQEKGELFFLLKKPDR